jgi:uncharacterized membrane protein
MTVVSFYFSFRALAMVSVSLVAALGGIGLITLAIFSFFVLKEKINRSMVVGMVVIGVGTTVFGLFTKEEAPVTINLSGLFLFVVAAIGLSLIIALISVARGYWYAGVMFGTVSGLFGGISMAFQKCSVASGQVNLQLLTNVFFYGSAIATGISFLVTQFALTKGTAITVVPSYYIAMLVLPQIGAMLIFAEYLELIQWVGVALLVLGIVLLTRYELELPKESEASKKKQRTQHLTGQRKGSKSNSPSSSREIATSVAKTEKEVAYFSQDEIAICN